MPNIYIANKTRRKLQVLIGEENRPIANEVDHLCNLRLKELNIRDDATSSLSKQGEDSKSDGRSQE